ncbi:MAG: hypothetical protein QOI63_1089 [Thermoplasmata archaeon]|nr:hypothetical protein [Thermoplasmata archaeon]
MTHGSATYTAAHVEGTTSGGARALYVFPTGGQALQASIPCATAQAPLQNQIGAVAHADRSRATRKADVSQAVQITPCAPASVTGSFTVVLWDWNADATAQEGRAVLWSGKEKQDAAPDPLGVADGRPYVSRAQQVYLTVQDGTLTFPASGQPALLFVGGIDLAGASTVGLTEATGSLLGQQLQGHRLQLAGRIDAALAHEADRMVLRVADGLHGVDVDGRSYAVASTTTAPGRAWWPWLTGGLGLVAVPVLAAPLVRRRRALRVHATACRAKDLLCRLDANAALPLTAKLLRLEPKEPEWFYLHGLALHGAGALGDAHQQHEAASALKPEPGLAAQNAHAGALVAARLYAFAQGEERVRLFGRVLAWIESGAGADGRILGDMAMNGELQPFLSLLEKHPAP